jgi:hypothetical protein
LALDYVLNTLALQDARKCQVVEMKFFGGLSTDEIAHSLQVSPDTVLRDWKLAKLWLLREMEANETAEQASGAGEAPGYGRASGFRAPQTDRRDRDRCARSDGAATLGSSRKVDRVFRRAGAGQGWCGYECRRRHPAVHAAVGWRSGTAAPFLLDRR